MKKSILIIIAITLLGMELNAAPKYVTICNIYGNAGDSIECKLVPNPQHVKPDTTWSSYRMHRDGLAPINTTTDKGTK